MILSFVLAAQAVAADQSFLNDVIPIFTKADCASSSCHGSVRGQKGFKLSLFGSDPDFDYNAFGNRIDRAKPEESLILKKPTTQVAHGGGLRFKADSTEYKTLLRWIAAGARRDEGEIPKLKSLAVTPGKARLVGLGSKVRITAKGTYSDGSSRDLTDIVRFSSNIPGIASVSASGEVVAEAVGETAIMVRTLGQAAAVPILVVKQDALSGYRRAPRNNYIDEAVFSKLETMNIVPSELCTDEEFLRRVYLDVVGAAPAIEEAERWLAGTRDRAKLIDELLDRPERADVWTMRFADMFRAGYNEAGQKGGNAYARWFRDQMRKNVRYDEMVRKLLVSQGRHDFEGISNFYFVSREIDPEEAAVNVSQLLLGLQIECARCHNHPWEKWSQDDFYGFSAFFARVERKDMYLNNHNATYLKESGEVIHPRTKQVMQPKYLGGAVEAERPGEDVREKLAAWITSPKNPYFARATVNRVWKFYLGRGIVELVDDFRVTNPPVNEALLDGLARDFIEHGFSLKQIERRILNSRVYQLSSVTNETNRGDETNYSHFFVRRLMSEQLLDTMTQVTGVAEKLPSQPLGRKAMQIAVLPYGKPHQMMKLFGRNELREVICERDTKPSVAQVMHMVSGDTLHRQVTAKGGRLDQYLAGLSDRQVVEKLYVAALTRKPAPEEVDAALKGVGPENRRQMFEDLLWTLFNSKEFLFHH